MSYHSTEEALADTSSEQSRLEALEASFKERERELQQARRIARLGTWRWNVATDTAVWSEEVYQAFGLDPSGPAPNYAEMQALNTPESGARRDALVKKALEDGEPYEHEIEVVLADGSPHWFVMHGEAGAHDANGRVTELHGTIQDITDRKRTELALRERERELQEAQRINRIGTWNMSVREGSVWWSPEVYRAFAADPEGPPLRPPLLDRLFVSGYDRMAEAFERAQKLGEPYEVDAELQALDGTRRWICARGEVSRWGPSGEVLELRGTIQDVTDRKRTEEALRERERRFRDLAESLPELVWVSEPDGLVSYINHSFEVYAGLQLADIEGRDAFDKVHPEDQARAETLWRRSLTTGEPYSMEVRLQRQDGIYRTFLARAVATHDEQGAIERWVGTATDIHDQKLAEEVVRRTEKLAATGRLAASMAHEINNPLAAVTNSLYLALLDAGLSDQTRGYLVQAEQELARVAAVTTQTLRFHQQSTSPAEVNLGDVMDTAYALFEARFRSRGITVRREYQCMERLLCRGDELRQVFANLLSNALDASEDGGAVRIRIRSASDAAGESGVSVCVADRGHGIPKELQRQVFEPFITTKEATGTGLGLWVLQGIVHRHKGSVRLRSRVDAGQGRRAGTVFRLFFPRDGME
jgi:PAS domain S-box-containing protein